MVNRRDLLLGLMVLAVFIGMIFIVLLSLTALTVDGSRVTSKSVGIIEIIGPIVSPMPVVESLERYISDDNILAIVIRLNTPGGGVSATQEIYETVKKARRAGKKIVASMGAVAASGGYYVAAACDTVVATPGTITGSIGVIASFSEFSNLFEKIGITFNVRKTGKFKDTGSIARKMTDEEKALIDELIMDTHEQFVQAVFMGRNLDPDFVRENADGRVFTGRQALNIGFVDILGTYQEAIDLAGTMVGLGKNPPVHKVQKDIFRRVLIDGISNLISRSVGDEIPSISYKWVY
ncbi:MAG: signal peptide peptidase SppA [Candidatus Latescibacteria bacterium]|nr:signal peptide peptidase SppA [Candidatus Latescibacterota bacterium]